jgi:hypothetical protein
VQSTERDRALAALNEAAEPEAPALPVGSCSRLNEIARWPPWTRRQRPRRVPCRSNRSVD